MQRRRDGSRILVVEDHADFRLLVTLALEDVGYIVDASVTAERAVHLLDAHAYDLVLTDYSLPGRSGLYVLSEANARDIAAVIVTGDPDAPGIPYGAEVVRKPVDFDRLFAQVRRLLASDDTSSSASEGRSDGADA